MSVDPRAFYETMLKPAYSAWLDEPYEEWRAKAAVGFANDLAERFAIYLDFRGGPTKYREFLRTNICHEFGWIWDVADGTKHFRLTRGARRVSTADQTSFRLLKIDDWPDFDSVKSFDDHGAIFVTGDDGSDHDLADLLYSVMEMFKNLLAAHSL